MKKILLAPLALALAMSPLMAIERTITMSNVSSGESAVVDETSNPVQINFQIETEGTVSMVIELDEDAPEKSLGEFDVYSPDFHAIYEEELADGVTSGWRDIPLADCQKFITFDATQLPRVTDCKMQESGVYLSVQQKATVTIKSYTGPSADYIVEADTPAAPDLLGAETATGSLSGSQDVGAGIAHELTFPHVFTVAELLDDADNGTIGNSHSRRWSFLIVRYTPQLGSSI